MAWPADGGWRHLTKRITRGKIHLVTKCMVDDVGSTLQGSIPSKRTEARDAFHVHRGFLHLMKLLATWNLPTIADNQFGNLDCVFNGGLARA